MPTNALGPGTCNITLNVPVEERSELSRMAARLGISVGEFIRRAIARKAAEIDSTSALRIAEARSRRASFLASRTPVLLLVGIFALSAVTKPEERRPVRVVRNVRSIRRWEEGI